MKASHLLETISVCQVLRVLNYKCTPMCITVNKNLGSYLKPQHTQITNMTKVFDVDRIDYALVDMVASHKQNTTIRAS